MTILSGFKSETTSLNIEDIAPIKVEEYITKYFNRDLLGARMKVELPIPILDIFRYPLEVRIKKKFQYAFINHLVDMPPQLVLPLTTRPSFKEKN